MAVFLLHRVPFLVFAKQRFVELVPATFLGFESSPESARNGGRQILHGCKPDFKALFKGKEAETFFTILQEDRWYLAPDGVL